MGFWIHWCVFVCLCTVYSGCPWGWRALPVILPSLLPLPIYIHKACHVDQVATGPKAFYDCQKCTHANVWLYNCSLIFGLWLQCTTEQQCLSSLPRIQRLLCFCGSLLQSDLFIMQSVFKEKREELLSAPESFMMDSFHVHSRMTGRLRPLWSQSDSGWASKEHTVFTYSVSPCLFTTNF